ncbi:hypothetical protein ACQJBY_059033 [Aegilops geniculata]
MQVVVRSRRLNSTGGSRRGARQFCDGREGKFAVRTGGGSGSAPGRVDGGSGPQERGRRNLLRGGDRSPSPSRSQLDEITSVFSFESLTSTVDQLAAVGGLKRGKPAGCSSQGGLSGRSLDRGDRRRRLGQRGRVGEAPVRQQERNGEDAESVSSS